MNGNEELAPDELLADADRQLTRKLADLASAIYASVTAGLWEPTLILLYSGIDAMAWLDRPLNQPDVHPDDFIEWIDKYLLPTSDLPCNSADLYGARCGLLHSHTGDSRKHRELKVKKLFYCRTVGGETIGIIQFRMNEKFFPPHVDLDALIAAFTRGASRFQASLVPDDTKRKIVLSRVWQSYYSQVRFG